jgi:nicotinamidase-related amidase
MAGDLLCRVCQVGGVVMDGPGQVGAANGVRLGAGRQQWLVSPTHVDMAPPEPPPRKITIAAAPQAISIDLNRTAIIVVDMQNDFCAPGGWVDNLGADLAPERAPIRPLQALVPALRQKGVPIVWLNWGNRPDRLNLSPTVLHCFNPDGASVGIGDAMPGTGARVLEKDSKSAAVVDELVFVPGDIAVDKYRISGFWDTPLDSILRNLGIRTLLFTGVNIDQCVLHSLTDAGFLGYGCVLVEDCCGTTSPDFCTQSTIWNVRTVFGFVTGSSEILAALSDSPAVA